MMASYVKNNWLNSLRSKDYRQHFGGSLMVYDSEQALSYFNALGVLVDIALHDQWLMPENKLKCVWRPSVYWADGRCTSYASGDLGETGLPEEVQRWAGIYGQPEACFVPFNMTLFPTDGRVIRTVADLCVGMYPFDYVAHCIEYHIQAM